MMRLIALLIFMLFVFVAFLFLQVFLSKRENRWVGLVLPAITFCLALIVVLSVALDNYYGLPVVPITFVSFTPTAVLLAIYAAHRGKRGRRRALDKMSLQDLD